MSINTWARTVRVSVEHNSKTCCPIENVPFLSFSEALSTPSYSSRQNINDYKYCVVCHVIHESTQQSTHLLSVVLHTQNEVGSY
jgi:hypothetical protein